MQMFDVYPRMPFEPVAGKDCRVRDAAGVEYLDFYSGHAVVSIGHGHPRFTARLGEQLRALAFYSNAVPISLQDQLAEMLGRVSGYEEYRLFLCNSGAEANENALKMAALHTGRSRFIAFERSFHGRTALAASVTDDARIRAATHRADVSFLPFNDAARAAEAITPDVAAVIVEGIQGVAGVRVADDAFLRTLREACDRSGTLLVLDEVQSGCGRSGRYFAHQHAGVQPDLVTMAKGMGNGFPVGGVILSPMFQEKHGLLGSTFGGNHLACAAAIAVLETIVEEGLMENAAREGAALMDALRGIGGVADVRGRGWMIGVSLDRPAAALRAALLDEHRIVTGSASDPNTLRLLPPLTARAGHAEEFLDAFTQAIRWSTER